MLEKNDKIRDYTLVKFLGRGQFGEVWLAEKQLKFGNRSFRHALKFLSKVGNEIDMKLAEAEIDAWMEASGHPNVMSVLDMFAHRNYFIIVSEFAEGGSLGLYLQKNDGRAPTLENAIKLISGILSGIEHLHSRNIVHRDLKPDNILLQGNYPRITDFGISRIVSTNSVLTNVVGSPAYMSPESFDGIKSPQTDIWSAGVILYEMLTGQLPYASETIFGLAAAIRYEDPQPLPDDVPLALRVIVGRALQKDLSIRYLTAQEMRADIEKAGVDLRFGFRKQELETEQLPNYLGISDPFAVTERVEWHELPKVEKTTTSIENDEALTHVRPSDKDTLVGATDATHEIARFNVELSTKAGAGPISAVDTVREPLTFLPVRGRRLAILSSVAGAAILAVAGFILTGTMFMRSPGGLMAGNSVSGSGGSGSMPAVLPANLNCESPEVKKDTPPDMVCIDGGSFTMGRSGGPKGTKEGPAHTEAVGPYLIDKFEVTNEQYAEFVQAQGAKPPQGWENGAFRNGEGRLPVTGVSWDDAAAYADWKKKRLPTEREWEFAARGPGGRLYPWGTDWAPGRANADGYRQSFTEVGSFEEGKSPYGVYDLVGNAMEWTQDDFQPYGQGGKASGLKTVRGVSFKHTREYATATFRDGVKRRGDSYPFTGFRCARNLLK
jgi:formylglycine-generating enzyme required for sulfatase activity/serine/threonine protein kinase